MSVLLDKLIAKKEYWTQIGFTYGQMIIDFVYMYENNLDIYFDRDNPRVCSVSYTHLTLPTTPYV